MGPWYPKDTINQKHNQHLTSWEQSNTSMQSHSSVDIINFSNENKLKFYFQH